jgi:Protein of unknown function (DUF3592)
MSSSSSSSDTRAIHVRFCWAGAALFVGGLVGFVGLQLAAARAQETATWPSVTGRIITAEASTRIVKTFGSPPRVARVADVRYVYFVNGQRYRCDGVRVIPMLHYEELPDELVDRFHVGMTVAVYYDPENPADALLIPEPTKGVRKFIRSFTFVSLFVAFLGLVFVASGVIHLRAGERAAQLATAARRAQAAPGQTAMGAPAAAAQAVLSSAPAATVPPRPRHWLLRLAQALLGLFLLLFGGLLAVTGAGTHNPAVSRSIEIFCVVLFAGVALAGGWLVTRGTRRPSAG